MALTCSSNGQFAASNWRNSEDRTEEIRLNTSSNTREGKSLGGEELPLSALLEVGVEGKGPAEVDGGGGDVGCVMTIAFAFL